MLPTQFNVLTVLGIWSRPNWTSNRKRYLYKLYSLLVNLLMFSLGLSQLARLIFIKQNFKEFNDTFFILLSTNFTCFKGACDVLIHKRIINLLDMFKKDCCIPRDDAEKTIQKKYNDICRSVDQ
jgi:hypothetical protein